MSNRIKSRLQMMSSILLYNKRTFFLFEVTIKAGAALIVLPILWGLLTASMVWTGHTYLTPENLSTFVSNPITIVLGVLSILIVSLYTFADIVGVLMIYNESGLNNKVSLEYVWRFVIRTVIRSFRKKNRKILLIPIIYLVLMYNGAIFGVLSTLSVPEFLFVLFRRAKYVILTIVALWLLVQIYAVRRLYVIHYYVIGQYDFYLSKEMANQINTGRKLRDYGMVWLFQIGYYLGYLFTLGLGLGLALIISRLSGKMTLFSNITLTALWITMACVLFVFAALSIPLGMYVLTRQFFLYRYERGESVYSVCENEEKKLYLSSRIMRVMEALFAIAMIIGGVIWFRVAATGSINPSIEYLHTTEITAHRGASRTCPENTMAAFRLAVEQGADWIELDIQQSKDGQIFVMHDNSFRRTTGVKKFAWELDYAEIEQLDAGSYQKNGYKEEKIPLLSEVIDFAKENNIRLNIEMKPNGHSYGIEQKVVDMICEKEFQSFCVITSQGYQMLKRIKEIDENIFTVYVMSLAMGNINKLDAADAFSIEANSVSKRMVSRVHNAGKQIYVWTVNSASGMRRMMDLNVDNIITDNVNLAYKCIYDVKANDIIHQYVRFLLSLY